MSKLLIAMKPELLSDRLLSSLSQYDIHICHTGGDALAQIDAFQPDILLIDLMLPGMDGITVLRKASYKPPVILALTNLITHGVLTEAAAVGIQAVSRLPCTARHIAEQLDKLTGKAPSSEG